MAVDMTLYKLANKLSSNFFEKYNVYDNEEHDKYERSDFVWGVYYDLEKNMSNEESLKDNIEYFMPEYDLSIEEIKSLCNI